MKITKTAFAIGLMLLLALGCGIPQEQFDAVTADLQARTSDLQSTQARIVELQDSSTVTASVVLGLERDFSDVQAQLDESESLQLTTKSELDTTSDKLADADTKIDEMAADLVSQGKDIIDLDLKIDGLESAVAVAVLAAEELTLALSEQNSALQTSQEKASDLAEDLASLVETNGELQAQIVALQAQVSANSEAGVQSEIDALIVERDSLVAKVDQLATLTEDYISDPKVEINTSGLACTGSMLPLLHCGDIVIMQTNLRHSDIQEDDIISFRRRDCTTGRSVTDSITLHRVVDIDGGWFVTQGDNNYTVDSCRLPLINVTGKLLAYIEDIYPEHYMETSNYEAIKTSFNNLQSRFDRKLKDYEEQVELLEDAEDDYKDGFISFSKYSNIWDDTESDRLALIDLAAEVDDQADTFFALQDLIIQRRYNDADWDHLVN